MIRIMDDGVRVAVGLSLIAAMATGLPACGDPDAPTRGGSKGPSTAQDDDDEDDAKDDGDETKTPSKTIDAGKTPTGPKTGTDAKVATEMKDAGTAPSGADPFCDVLPILKAKCGECHGAEVAFGAPMSIDSYDDLIAASPITKSKKVFEQVGVRLHDTKAPMPPTGQPALTKDELAKLDSYIALGAPKPSGECKAVEPETKPDAGGIEVVDWPADCEERHKFLANDNGQPHKVAAGIEGYVDFFFDVPWKSSVQAVAFRPVTDNKKVLHHWILYQGQNSFLNGWSPGKLEKVLPPDVGVHMPAGGTGRLKMTFHYYNKTAGAKAEVDSSGVEVCVTTKPRKNTAFTFPFTASATAPAGQTVMNENTCTVNTDKEIHLVTSSPHMHKLGVHAKFEVIRKSGERVVITDKPFDFENQTDEVIDVKLNNGDKVSVTCGYKNDTARTVMFGQNTDQEMCFNFSLYYPMCGMTCTGGDAFAAAISSSQGGGCPR